MPSHSFDVNAGIAQLVEHDLAKVGVASSSLVSRSKFTIPRICGGFFLCLTSNFHDDICAMTLGNLT